MRAYNLAIGARARLEYLRSKSANWREARHWGLHSYESAYCTLDEGKNGNARIWYAHTGEQFRHEKFADDIVRIGHNGWYTDPHQDETARGIVGSLPHGKFIAGYYWSSNGERVYFDEIHDSAEDAARMADEHARVMAEHEREYQEKWNKAREIESRIESHEHELIKMLEIRHIPGKAWRQHPREIARELITKIREDRETLADDFADVLE